MRKKGEEGKKGRKEDHGFIITLDIQNEAQTALMH